MTELNAGYNSLGLNKGVTIASVRDEHFIDAQGVGNDKICTIS